VTVFGHVVQDISTSVSTVTPSPDDLIAQRSGCLPNNLRPFKTGLLDSSTRILRSIQLYDVAPPAAPCLEYD
jgi:hypothetical protein